MLVINTEEDRDALAGRITTVQQGRPSLAFLALKIFQTTVFGPDIPARLLPSALLELTGFLDPGNEQLIWETGLRNSGHWSKDLGSSEPYRQDLAAVL